MLNPTKWFLSVLLLSLAFCLNTLADINPPTRDWRVQVASHTFGFAEYDWGTMVYLGWGGIAIHSSLETLLGFVTVLTIIAFAGYLLIIRRHGSAA